MKRRLRVRSRLQHLLHRARRSGFGLRVLQNAAIDLRYGGLAGGNVPNPFASLGAVSIQSTGYAELTHLFRENGLVIRPGDVLVDVGCGKGRVINWWLRQGLTNEIIGLELVAPVARRTRARLRGRRNVRIVTGDAIANLPAHGTLFYLYNPFDADTVERLKDALFARAERRADLRIVYFNSRHAGVFARDPRWRVQPLRTSRYGDDAVLVTLAREEARAG